MLCKLFAVVCVLVLVCMTSVLTDHEAAKPETKLDLKRSDGLLRDMFNLAVEQKVERFNLKGLVEETKKNFNKEMAKLNGEFQSLKQDVIQEVKKTNNAMKSTKKDVQDLKAMLADLKAGQQKLNKEGDIRGGSIKTLEKENNQLTNKFKQIKKKLETMIKDKHAKVAFMARVYPGGPRIAANGIIPYNKVYTNIGGGYNNTDYKFHCPQDGLYLISASLETKETRILSDIMKNGKQIGRMVKGTSSRVWGTAINTIIVPLKKGDKVWVKSFDSGQLGDICFFTGVLISP